MNHSEHILTAVEQTFDGWVRLLGDEANLHSSAMWALTDMCGRRCGGPPKLFFLEKTVWASGLQAPRLGLGLANIQFSYNRL